TRWYSPRRFSFTRPAIGGPDRLHLRRDAAAIEARSSRPIENDLAALTREHGRKGGFEFLGGVVVGDDRRQVEAALYHRHHLVPGLEHLAPVHALDLEPLEDDLIPVDRHARW